MRIAYLAGPANAESIYREWSGDERQAYFGTDYFKQFLQLCEDLGAECHAVTWHGPRALTRHGRFTFDNRPLPTSGGLLYHLGMIWWHLKLLPTMMRFRPDVLILTGNQGYWWTLAPVRARYLPSFHCVPWPKFGRVKPISRLLLTLDKWLILKRCKTVVVTSHDIARQVQQLTDAHIVSHLPTYSAEQFSGIEAPRWSSNFRVIFVSRIERNKGVFDLLEMARNLPDVGFDVCGNGTAMEEAMEKAPDNVHFHGFCDQSKLSEIMNRAHVAIVPTRSEFEAGFEMTCAEAILSGRPLITSAVCPALEYLRPATIEVEPDNTAQYIDAIRTLSTDPVQYEELVKSCRSLQGQFFDTENSWINAMKLALRENTPTVATRGHDILSV